MNSDNINPVPNTNIKIAVLCLPGLQSFLRNIVDHLTVRYQVRTCYSINPQEIQQTVQWADLVWLEWANELSVGVTNNPQLLSTKKVICRLHSYEAFEDYIDKIDWRKIDDLIFVAPHIRDIALHRIPDMALKVKRMPIIPNGVDMQRFSFSHRSKGYHLAFIGDINYKKGPMLLLHAFRELTQVDRRYRLHVAGRMQNTRYALYFAQMIREMGIEDNVQMDGWVEDIQGWLVNKNYIVCSSVLEGHPVGLMEAMACGIKPVIHNFVGARELYPDEFIWNTIPEFVSQVVSESYDSNTYRDYINDHFSLKLQLERIDRLIVEPESMTSDAARVAPGQVFKAVPELQKTGPAAARTAVHGLAPQVMETLAKCIQPDMKVLSMGCGYLETVDYIGKLGARTVCIDESAELIHRARQLSAFNDIEFCRCDYENLQLNERFDLIVIDRVFEQLPKSRASRVLASLIRHASDTTVILLNMADGRFLEFAAATGKDNHRIARAGYTPDVVLGLFAAHHYQPYHIEFYGVDMPVQYNVYLFASAMAFQKTYRLKTITAGKRD